MAQYFLPVINKNNKYLQRPGSKRAIMKWGPESVPRYRLLPLWQQKWYDQQKYWGGYYPLNSPCSATHD